MRLGRPPKYKDEETRKKVRREQNRRNQRKCRLRKKLKKEIEPFVSDPIEMDMKYKEEMVKHFNNFDFNYFFTGTIGTNSYERKELKNYKCDNLNYLLESSLMNQIVKKTTIKSLRNYTEKYLESLSSKGLITRWFVVFEMGNDNKYHVHIMLGTNNTDYEFMDYSENHWLLGRSLTIPINTEEDKLKTLNYCVKEFKPSSYSIKDLNKIDNCEYVRP